MNVAVNVILRVNEWSASSVGQMLNCSAQITGRAAACPLRCWEKLDLRGPGLHPLIVVVFIPSVINCSLYFCAQWDLWTGSTCHIVLKLPLVEGTPHKPHILLPHWCLQCLIIILIIIILIIILLFYYNIPMQVQHWVEAMSGHGMQQSA